LVSDPPVSGSAGAGVGGRTIGAVERGGGTRGPDDGAGFVAEEATGDGGGVVGFDALETVADDVDGGEGLEVGGEGATGAATCVVDEVAGAGSAIAWSRVRAQTRTPAAATASPTPTNRAPASRDGAGTLDATPLRVLPLDGCAAAGGLVDVEVG
jgi:hypothetical protein